MAMADINSMHETSRTSSLYIPSTNRVQPLKDIVASYLIENFHLIINAGSSLPPDIVQMLFNFCLERQKLDNTNFGFFAAHMYPVNGALMLRSASALRDKMVLSLISGPSTAPLLSNLVVINLTRTHLAFSKYLAPLCRANQHSLKSLCLKKTHVNDKIIGAITPYITGLVELDLADTFVTDESMIPLVRALTQLKALILCKTDITEATVREIGLKTGLEVLNITNIQPEIENWIELLAKNPLGISPLRYLEHDCNAATVPLYKEKFPNLTGLALRFVDYENVLSLVDALPDILEIIRAKSSDIEPSFDKCTKLHFLSTSRLPSPSHLEVMAKTLTNLTKLCCEDGSITDEQMRKIGLFTQLRSFRIRRGGGTSTFSYLSAKEALSRLPNLTELELNVMHYELLADLQEVAPRLRTLKYYQSWMDDVDVFTLVFKFPQGIHVILPELEKLSFQEKCPSGFVHFILPKLTRLTSHKTPHNERLESLISHSPLLRKLYLPNMNAKDMTYVTEKFSQLEELHLVFCKSLPPQGWKWLHSLKYLQVLTISSIPPGHKKISLVDTLPLLRDLRITGAGIQELELSSNSLQILKLHDNSLSKLTLTAKSLREFSIQLGKLLASTYSAYMPNVVKFAAVINYALIPSTVKKKNRRHINEEEAAALERNAKENLSAIAALWEAVLQSLPSNKVEDMQINCLPLREARFELPALKRLLVSCAPRFHIKLLSLRCPQLTYLHFVGTACAQIDISMSDVLTNIRMDVQTSTKKHKTDKLYWQLVQQVPNVTSLEVVTTASTAEGIAHALRGLTKLSELQCCFGSDGVIATLKAILEHASPRLQMILLRRGVLPFEQIDAFEELAHAITERHGLIPYVYGRVALPIIHHRAPDGRLPSIQFRK